MKIKLLIISIAIALCLSAAPALAALTQIKLTDGPGSGSGGAFWAEVVDGSISYDNVIIPQGASFLTFCVENNEFLSTGKTYWVSISKNAILGGSGGDVPGGDPLDPITAALYNKYLALGDMTNATADEYQLAIWKVEEEAVYDTTDKRWEKGSGDVALHPTYQNPLYTEAYIDALIGSVTPSGIGSCRVMNLWGDADGTLARQDLIVVPVPAAVLLGIIGLGVAGWKLRKYA